jgi:hypothetical protein
MPEPKGKSPVQSSIDSCARALGAGCGGGVNPERGAPSRPRYRVASWMRRSAGSAPKPSGSTTCCQGQRRIFQGKAPVVDTLLLLDCLRHLDAVMQAVMQAGRCSVTGSYQEGTLGRRQSPARRKSCSLVRRVMQAGSMLPPAACVAGDGGTASPSSPIACNT